jgi:hypothetical protein
MAGGSLDEDFNYFRDGGAQREPKETHRRVSIAAAAADITPGERVTFVILRYICCGVVRDAATTSHYRSGIFTAACITSPLECVIHFFTPF